MNRRTFLARLGFGTIAAAAAATSVFDVEKLLWVPGEKTIFIPPTSVGSLGVWCDRCQRFHDGRTRDLERDYIQPAAQRLADDIDRRLLEYYAHGLPWLSVPVLG